MKIRILLISLLKFFPLIGGTFDGYKYVAVQTLKYQNEKIDYLGISGELRTFFSNKGLTVLTENSIQPQELEQNPCLLLNCLINHSAASEKTKSVTIIFTNCRYQVIYSKTGYSKDKSEKTAFFNATKAAISDVESISYKFNAKYTPKGLIGNNTEKTSETEESIQTYLANNKLDPIEGIYKAYQSDQLAYYKIGIIKHGDKFKAIVIETQVKGWLPGEVKAVFEPSSMKNFYSVTWLTGTKRTIETFGLLENESILTIEFSDLVSGDKRQDKFIKMFPITELNTNFQQNRPRSSGSGFFITTSGIIATNAHVIEKASKIQVTISTDKETTSYAAKVLLTDVINDVALLQITDDKFTKLTNIPYGIVENSEIGSRVFTIGYPLNTIMGSNFKVTDGIISSKSGISDDLRYYQISVPVQPGNSGGPLFNKDGNVIGLTTAKLNSQALGTPIENVNYAVKSSYLLNLYYMLPESTKLPTTSSLKSKELQDQVKILKNYVCLINVN
jgi:S1-C subfamily serine protease